MKKFLALLLMALLLIPALAMAEIPLDKPALVLSEGDFSDSQVSLSGSVSSGGLKWRVFPTSKKYTAFYSIGGQLQQYNLQYSCGCSVTYNCYDEAISITNSFSDRFGSGYRAEWNSRKNSWDVFNNVHHLVETFSAESLGHGYSSDTHESLHVKETTSPTRLPGNVAQCFGADVKYADLKEVATPQSMGGVWPDTQDKISSASGITEIKTGSVGTLWRMSSAFGNVYALYRTDGKYHEAYVGNVYFTTGRGMRLCRITGDKQYGINTYGHFNFNTGLLDEYQYYSADRSVNSVYNINNVLLSTETWDSNGAWWGLGFDVSGKWLTNPDGIGDGDKEYSSTRISDPSDEVLENILHAPGPAEYYSACVTNASQLDESLKGVPFIISDDPAMANVTPHIEATQKTGDHIRATEYDITLTGAGAAPEIDGSVTLTLGYPAGITSAIADDYDYLVIHEGADGTEYMSNVAGADNLTITANGPQVTATSFSPYTVIWGDARYLENYRTRYYPNAVLAEVPTTPAAPNLPQTGDTSNLALYAVLLTLSIGALAVVLVMSKRRASR